MSSEQYKKTTTTTNEPVLGVSSTKGSAFSGQPSQYTDSSRPGMYTDASRPLTGQQVDYTTTHNIHPTGYREETTTHHNVHPTDYHKDVNKSHTVDQTDVHGKKWSEEASMVGSDVREGLGKYKDVRPATGATGVDQTRGTGVVHETGHTDASVYRPRDMTDTATKEGSDQREGLGSAAKTTDKDTGKYKHDHEHDKHKHDNEHDKQKYAEHEKHHKHEKGGIMSGILGGTAATTTHSTTPYTSSTTGYTTSHADAYPASTSYTTRQGYPEDKTTGYSTSTTGYTDRTGTPSATHYKYDKTDEHYGSSPIHDRSDYTDTSANKGGIFGSSHTHDRSDYTDNRGVGYEDTATKYGSDQREGLGTGAAYGSSTGLHSDTSGTHRTGTWSETANKVGSDIREGLGSGSTHTGSSSHTRTGEYQ